MAYCCLIVFGKAIQKLFFGELRASEREVRTGQTWRRTYFNSSITFRPITHGFLCYFQNLKSNFWNFLFYKFIFIFGVMNVQTMEEVVLWCTWFTALGFIQLLFESAKERVEYV